MKNDVLMQQLENLNPWWQSNFQNQPLIARPFYSDILLRHESKVIELMTGARRVGKTTILKNVVQILLQQGVAPKNIIYITGELPALQNLRILDIYQTYAETMKPAKTHVFIDEVQELPNWQQQVKYLYDNYDSKIFLTGSSGLILSKQTAKLTGRFIETHVLPLSFMEFLDFKKMRLVEDSATNRQLAEDYVNTGGYPEYVLHADDSLLTQTVESIMYRDLLTHYGIRNPAILKDLLQLLCDKIGTPVSFNTIAKDLKMDPQTAQFYMQYLQDVYLVYPIFRQGKSHKAVKGFIPKYYLNDTGILRLFARTPREGHLFETAVFLHFFRRYLQTKSEVFYDYFEDQEVDFVVDGKKYDAKAKPLQTELATDVTYIVKATNDSVGYKQIELWKLLSQAT